jgi:hypothetical protein
VRHLTVFLLLGVIAGAVPLLLPDPSPASTDATFPGWPSELDGVPLKARPMTASDARFLASFPGRVGCFDAGGRDVIVRWVATPTRRLHPALDCFRALGYATGPLPALRDQQGRRWGCIEASRGATRVRVAERIVDTDGVSFSDVSSWYWAALLGRSRGPWWAYTVIEPV